MNLGTISKIGLLLVVIGFFLPVACDSNGFDIASGLMKANRTQWQGILLYVMFISAAVGVVLCVLAFLKIFSDPRIDWIAVCLCTLSGLIILIAQISNVGFERLFKSLQVGGILIVIGLLLALICQLLGSRR
jgi:hypothetical protein